MAYLVLARKYRSQTFSEVLGQEHVTRTLQNAILAGRLAHAILFCGPRGTGKTSIARILAKSMNCEEGPTVTPCNQCRSCVEITAGHGVDVMEIDGASNNSVDQIRELREGLGYAPAHSPYRIYIIDEVHMLSTAAFNALLKTLEEPPEHVLFFFATTEAHKIPLTILSRCQRHDLRRVSLETIKNHLGDICKKEGVAMEEEALDMVAREADGSVRDSLSLLDRVIAGIADRKGDREAVAGILGLAARSEAFRMAEALFSGNVSQALSLVWDLHQAGVDLKKFHGDLSQHMRNLLVAKMQPADFKNILDLPDAAIKNLIHQAGPLPEFYISKILETLMAGETNLRYATNPRLGLETLLLKCLRIQPVISMGSLVEKLDLLGKALLQNPMPELVHIPETASAKKEIPVTPVPESKKPSEEEMPTLHENGQTSEDAEEEEISAPSMALEEMNPPEEAYEDILLADTDEDEDPFDENSFDEEGPPDFAEYTAKKMAEAADLWQKLITRLREKSPSLGELFATKTSLKKRTDQSMEVEIQGNGFSLTRLNDENNIRLVESLIHEVYGMPLRLVVLANAVEDTDILKKHAERERLKNDAKTHVLVQEALEIFKGEIVDVTIVMEDL